MTIPINILQSMISRNRNYIYDLEHRVSVSIDYSAYYRKHNDVDDYIKEEIFIIKMKKEIKALVAIQKALKKEIREQIIWARLRTSMQRCN